MGAAALPWLAGPAPAQEAAFSIETLVFESRSKPIRAALYAPARPNGAAVVFLHGSGGIGPAYLTLAEQFATEGFKVLVPAYYDAAADDGVRPEPVMDAWRAVGSDAVDWMIGSGIDRRRVGVMGYSLGSYVAVDGALGNSRAAAAIGVAGGWDVYVPRPPRRRIPVLVIQSENDTHVSPESTRRWVDFLRQADVPVRLQVVRGAGHLYTPAQWTEVQRLASDFFQRTLL
jgi:dienelactone hydrolase